MTAGFELKEGKYDQNYKSVKDVKMLMQPFFDNCLRKESSYKFAMFQAIIDNVEISTPKTYKLTFDQLYLRFSEIYWILVFKYNIPQKNKSTKAPKTLAETIIEGTVEKYKIRRKTEFHLLPSDIQNEIVKEMKRKCSRYVIGALYTDTNKIMYSFSKRYEWVKLNPQFVYYVKEHKESILIQNFQAWAKYYESIVAIENKNVRYYQRLLKREFGNYSVGNVSRQVTGNSKKKNPLKDLNYIQNSYDAKTAKAVRKVLMQYPDLGLYLAQICEKVDSDKETVRTILEKAFWCRQEKSRYYYEDISDSDIIDKSVFGKWADESQGEEKREESEIDPERLRLLADPERLIKQLKREKGITHLNTKNHSAVVSKETPVSTLVSKQRKWDREEVIILVAEYFRTKNLSPKEVEESYQNISEFLRKREELLTGDKVSSTFRNYAGIRLQSSRIKSLDPDTKYGGMQGTKLQKEIVQEYIKDSKSIIDEAEKIYLKYRLPNN